MIRRIRELLYDQGFTITGARNKMQEILQGEGSATHADQTMLKNDAPVLGKPASDINTLPSTVGEDGKTARFATYQDVRAELMNLHQMLSI